MSGLAAILLGRGFEVTGSDIAETNITDALEDAGATIFYSQIAENVHGTEVFVYSAAIKKDNPEFVEAKRLGLKMLRRSELLGILMAQKRGIAIAGTHGKTTTSTMLALILEDAGFNPTISIGGEVKNIGGNAKDGKGEFFVAEACEYDRSFLDLHPHVAIITNVEEDHLDTYGDLKGILEGFGQFLAQVDPGGFICVAAEDSNIKKISKQYPGHVIDYGLEEGQFQAKDIKIMGHKTVFTVTEDGKKRGELTLVVPGEHNILNALAVTATALNLGVKFQKIAKSLGKFQGARRRFEIKGQKNDILVIDDYGHHPTEIQATLAGLRSYYPNQKVWCVFQAHQYSRTRFLLKDFGQSFKDADHVIVAEIYAARDTQEDKDAVNCEILAEEISKNSHNAICIPEFSEIVEYLKQNVQKGEIVITIGAGPVYKVGEEFLNLI